MELKIGKSKVIKQDLIAEDIYRMWIETPWSLDSLEPGEFMHVRCNRSLESWDPLLRRPLSIENADKAARKMSFIYRVEGRGTKELSLMRAGDLLDVLGPLGKGFPIGHIKEKSKVVIIGGGVGVPPLYYLSRILKSKGAELEIILGFRTSSQSFLIEEFKELGNVKVMTDSGDLGKKGTVIEPLKELAHWDSLYTCGPTPMLRAVQTYCEKTKERSPEDFDFMSLEERMGCGVGACLACVCPSSTDSTKQYKICCDGPVFSLYGVRL